MKTITLRGVPDDLAELIEKRSRETGLSLNKTVIGMLREKTSNGGDGLNHDLDFLAGTWTEEEADAFDRFLAEHRQIDEELWK